MKVGSIVEAIGYGNSSANDATDLNRTLRAHGFIWARTGSLYVVRGITHVDPFIGIYLEEIVNKPMLTAWGFMEMPFNIKSFRELLPPQSIEALIGDALTAPVKHRELILITQ